jgi:hypothetical protein
MFGLQAVRVPTYWYFTFMTTSVSAECALLGSATSVQAKIWRASKGRDDCWYLTSESASVKFHIDALGSVIVVLRSWFPGMGLLVCRFLPLPLAGRMRVGEAGCIVGGRVAGSGTVRETAKGDEC